MTTQNETTVTIPDRKAPIVGMVKIKMTYQDVPIDIDLDGPTTAEIERIINGMLRREGWRPAKPVAMGGGFPPRKPQTPPYYNDQGDVCCPIHRTPLKQLQFSAVCSTKLPQGDPGANERGYCKYSWKEK